MCSTGSNQNIYFSHFTTQQFVWGQKTPAIRWEGARSRYPLGWRLEIFTEVDGCKVNGCMRKSSAQGRNRDRQVCVWLRLHICDGVSQSPPVSEMCEGSVTEVAARTLQLPSSLQHTTAFCLWLKDKSASCQRRPEMFSSAILSSAGVTRKKD